MKRILIGMLAGGLGVSASYLALADRSATVDNHSIGLTAGLESPAPTPTAASAESELQWLTSLPDAKAQAQRENKLVLVDFTGSDWCVWCKKLDAETFSKPEFAEYAKKNLVLVMLDYPHSKPQPADLKAANDALMHKYNIDGFPTLLAMKGNGKVVWKQEGYLEGGPSAMIAKLDEAKQK
jgi:thioredoxin-related protein